MTRMVIGEDAVILGLIQKLGGLFVRIRIRRIGTMLCIIGRVPSPLLIWIVGQVSVVARIGFFRILLI